MFEHENSLNEFMLIYLRLLIKDLSDHQIYDTPVYGMNTPAWCLGHLAVECDSALSWVGVNGVCPPGWREHFAQGSKPADLSRGYVAKDELYRAVRSGYAQLRQTCAEFTPELAGKPCHSEFLQNVFKTEGEWYAHMLTTHVAMHAGNMAAWRRAMKLPPVIG